MLIDTHCHLNFKDFREDADDVIKKTLNEDVQMIIVGSQYSTSRRAVEYADKYNRDGQGGVWAAVGIHPVHLTSQKSKVKSLKSNNDNDLPEKLSIEKFDYSKYLELAKNEKVVAIGEVGLDYHHFDTANLQINYKSTNVVSEGVDKNNDDDMEQRVVDFEMAKKEVAGIIELQKSVFRDFVRLADEVGKPLVIHGWNADKKDKELVEGAVAYEDILEIVSSSQFTVHGKSGDQSVATSSRAGHLKTPHPPFRERGDDPLYPTSLKLRGTGTGGRRGVVHSFIGNYKIALRFIEEGFVIGLNGIITYSESYDRLIKEIGLENIILETDAPYLTPNPLERYSRNEPLNVKLVAQKIADVLEIDVEKVEKITTKNAQRLFKI